MKKRLALFNNWGLMKKIIWVDILDSQLGIKVETGMSFNLFFTGSRQSWLVGKQIAFPQLVDWYSSRQLLPPLLNTTCNVANCLSEFVLELTSFLQTSFGALMRKKEDCTWWDGTRRLPLFVLVGLASSKQRLETLLS